jgi:hypothetical protein
MQITTTTQLTLEGKGTVTVRPSDHLATGGEGSVYRVGSNILKLYSDPNKMVADDMPSKVKVLSAITYPNIISPKGLIKAPSPVGYYMDYVDGTPMTLYFGNDFRAKNGIDLKATISIVESMVEIISIAHDAGAILVDANELNWLVKDNCAKAIDVDSWSIGKWKPSVIMPSIRDWHSKTFDEMTDWFSWGIVTFQLFTGIHPYKGTLPGFARGAMIDRMKANASVFSPSIKLNNAVRDFQEIPKGLREWYRATFQDGVRVLPPSSFGAVVPVLVKAVSVQQGKGVTHKMLYAGHAIDLFYCGVFLTSDRKLIELKTLRPIFSTSTTDVKVVEVTGGYLVLDGQDLFYVNSVDLSSQKIPFNVNYSKTITYKNRAFVVSDQGLSEVDVKVFAKPLASVSNTWQVLVNSTKWVDGGGIVDGLGAKYLVLPFGQSNCATVRAKELDGLTQVVGYGGDRFFSCVSIDANGDYIKSEFCFSEDYKAYKYWQGATDTTTLNIATLQKGVVATIIDDGRLNLFGVGNPSNIMKFDDSSILSGMRLFNVGEEIYYLLNGSIYSLKTK